MGTRNLTMVQKDNQIKIAQYGQWDGYIEGNGVEIFNFIKDILLNGRMDDFKAAIDNVVELTDDELRAHYKELGIHSSDGLISWEDCERFKEHYPSLDRDMGADILQYVLDNNGCEIINNIAFANNSLFCEYGYIVNLDEKKLEVYTGYQTTPLTIEDRFFNGGIKDEDFFPIKKIYEISFDEIATITSDDFIAKCNLAIKNSEN